MEERKIRKDLSEIVKNISVVTVPLKNFKKYLCKLELINGSILKLDTDENFIEVVKVLTDLTGSAIKSKLLIDEISEKTEGENKDIYTCVRYELTSGDVFRFFPKREHCIIIDTVYEHYKKNKKNG